MGNTGVPALPAANAFIFIKHHLCMWSLAFRAMTPLTPQVTALEKDSGSDSGHCLFIVTKRAFQPETRTDKF